MTLLNLTILLTMIWVFALACYIRTLVMPAPAPKR